MTEGALKTALPEGGRFPTRDLVELGVAYALILATIWTVNPSVSYTHLGSAGVCRR